MRQIRSLGTRWLLLLVIAAVPLRSETVLPASRTGHVMALKQVFLDGFGPFRMAIDTGNSSSLLRAEVASQIGLSLLYTVEQATLGGIRSAPAGIVSQVRAGTAVDQDVEFVIGPVRQPGADGILGQSWLVRHDYLIDYHRRRVVLDGPAPSGALETPLRSMDGRSMIVAELDGKAIELLLGSAVPALLLFAPSKPNRPAIFEMLQTNGEPALAAYGTAQLSLAGRRQRQIAVLRVVSSQAGPGLLPLSAFSAVHVSNRNGRVVFVP